MSHLTSTYTFQRGKSINSSCNPFNSRMCLVLKTQRTTRTKVKGKGLSFYFKQKTRQDYVIPKQEHKN
jgi:hypothetical protein